MMGLGDSVFRSADASLNRIGEGLRFLEEIARFILNDGGLSAALKTLRHDLIIGDDALNRRLLAARDAAGDVGADTLVPGETPSKDLPALLNANARRVAESLRVMEELARLPELSRDLDTDKFRRARFSLYTITQDLSARLLRRDKLDRLPGLYAILDTPRLKGRDPLAAAALMIDGGATAIQLRDNESPKKALLPLATALGELCARRQVLFIMNNEMDIALASDADGLHIGQGDLDAATARRLLPVEKILGVSVSDAEQAAAAEAAGADYLGPGAVFATATKDEAAVIGLEGLRDIRWASGLPLVAVGGIDKSNAAEVIAVGAETAAVISAVCDAADTKKAAQEIADIIGATIEKSDR